MPLTKTGKKVMHEMTREYGERKGKEIFYAKMNKDPEMTKKWHMKSKEHSKEALDMAMMKIKK